MMRLTFKTFEDNIKNSVGIQIEVANDRLDNFNDVSRRYCCQILSNIYRLTFTIINYLASLIHKTALWQHSDLVKLGNKFSITFAFFSK